MKALLSLPALLSSFIAGAEGSALPEWNINGSNTLRADYYDVDGDASSAPWPHKGGQYYDEFDLNMWRRVSPWESQRIQLSGVANDSDYRSDHKGGVLERGSFFWEKGDAGVPFRLQAGDYYASQTPNTIQLGLKGLQAELQPAANQSIQFFSGLRAPAYRDLGSDLGIYTGLSWLQEDEVLGAFNLTALHYDRDANPTQVGLSQDVYSLAWYRPFELRGHSLEFESELAHFSGEHDATGSMSEGDDQGIFAQLTGRSAPLGYRVLYERYGYNFRPAGGSATPDHRAIEGHVSWRFISGLQLRGRLQAFRDDLESANPLDTRVAGLSLAGPAWPGSSFYGRLESYIQEREDRNKAVDSDTHHISLDLSAPLNSTTSIRGGLDWTSTEDQLTAATSIKRQLGLALDTAFTAGAWQASVTPGVSLRRNTGSQDSTEIYPTLALSMTRPHHNLRFSYSLLNQDGHSPTSNDTDIQQATLAYDFEQARHRVGLELNRFDRDPDSGADTEAYRIGAYWRYSFDRPARSIAQVPTPSLAMDNTSLPSLLELSPGEQLVRIEKRLSASRLVPAYRLGNTLVYDAALFDGVDLQQKLALVHSAGEVEAVVLILEFEDPGDPAQMARDYAKVRNELLKRLGSPEEYREQGTFDANIAVDLARGRFERMLQWRTASGLLRFGVPRRLDGQVRMEIRRGATMPTGPMWSLEAVR
jgi:hypothetical protein